MMIAYRLLWLFFIATLINDTVSLNVSVYYESLCPDSIEFISNQFYSTYKTLENYLNVDLVPFGKATASNSTGHWKFKCQHGPDECYGNKVQSCVIALYSISYAVEFINCAMNSTDPSSNTCLEMCAESTGIKWESIENCLSSGEADKLLAENGKRTHSVTPRISFIPAIAFNGVYDKNLQNQARNHFLRVVCKFLKNKPNVCKSDIPVKVMIVI